MNRWLLFLIVGGPLWLLCAWHLSRDLMEFVARRVRLLHENKANGGQIDAEIERARKSIELNDFALWELETSSARSRRWTRLLRRVDR